MFFLSFLDLNLIFCSYIAPFVVYFLLYDSKKLRLEAYPNEWFANAFSRKDDYDFYLEFICYLVKIKIFSLQTIAFWTIYEQS